jgi:hypothetical protein
MRAYRLRDPKDSNTHKKSRYKIRLIEWNALYVRSCFRNNDSRSSRNSPLGYNAKYQLSMPCSKVVLHIRKQYFAASIAQECRRMKYDLRINHLRQMLTIHAPQILTLKKISISPTHFMCFVRFT